MRNVAIMHFIFSKKMMTYIVSGPLLTRGEKVTDRIFISSFLFYYLSFYSITYFKGKRSS